MLNVLWLASWYPNRYDRFNGDFVQRHAQAAAMYCQLRVISVQFVPTNWQKKLWVVETNLQSNFTETIIYLQESSAPPLLKKLVDNWNYRRVFAQVIKEFIVQSMPNLVHVHVPIKAGVLGVWVKKNWKIPLFTTEHWSIYNEEAFDRYETRSWLFKYQTKQILRLSDEFLPVSNNLGNSVNHWVIYKPFKVVYNVVDTTIFNYKPKKTTAHFFLIHVSILNSQKNPFGLLRSFALAAKDDANLRLRMVGHASNEIKAFADELGISPKVEFLGMLPQADVAQWLQVSDAFLLFSNYENMPCAIAEALCCGLPVISTQVGGIAEIINQSNGLLVAPKDELAAAKAILQLKQNAANYPNEEIALQAKKTFSYATIGKQINDIYLLHTHSNARENE